MKYHITINIAFKKYLKTWKNVHNSLSKNKIIYGITPIHLHMVADKLVMATISTHFSPLIPDRTTLLCRYPLYIPRHVLDGTLTTVWLQ